MTFWVYHTQPSTGANRRYLRHQEVMLAGGGLIQTTARQHLNGRDVGWTVSAAEMLASGGYDPASHALVIGAAPVAEGLRPLHGNRERVRIHLS